MTPLSLVTTSRKDTANRECHRAPPSNHCEQFKDRCGWSVAQAVPDSMVNSRPRLTPQLLSLPCLAIRARSARSMSVSDLHHDATIGGAHSPYISVIAQLDVIRYAFSSARPACDFRSLHSRRVRYGAGCGLRVDCCEVSRASGAGVRRSRPVSPLTAHL